MERFLLFVFGDNFPQGGWNDFKGDFPQPWAAHDALVRHVDRLINQTGEYHIIDRHSGETLEEGEIVLSDGVVGTEYMVVTTMNKIIPLDAGPPQDTA